MVQVVQLRNAHKMMTAVKVDKRKRELRVTFADGCVGSVPVKELKRHTDLDLDRVELLEPYVIQIGLKNNDEPTGVPWDFVRYHCDPDYAKEVDRQHHDSRQLLANNLKRLRGQEDWSQDRLAKEAGVGRITISRIENTMAHSTKLETLDKLAKAFDIKLVDLFRAI